MPEQIKNKKEGKKGNKKGTKYALGIMLNFLWMFILYRSMVFLGQYLHSLLPYAICSTIYLTAAAILLAMYYFCTSGEIDAANKEKYKPLFVWAFPIVIVLLLDVFEAVIFDNIINLFS